jgi:formylglycine-generating enzyme
VSRFSVRRAEPVVTHGSYLMRISRGTAALIAASAALLLGVHFARTERDAPARCPPGLELIGARCCGEGQVLRGEHCSGSAHRCAAGMDLDADDACIVRPGRVHYAGGSLRFGPSDWEGSDPPLREMRVSAFDLDTQEVTLSRFGKCVAAGACAARADNSDSEPGLPVRNLSPTDAALFCRFAGGRLPASAEWLFAAAGVNARRYPWGNTGLVCRRAAFGLARGPCGVGGTGPDLAGARPDGGTPEGVLDLAGNVAEWTLEKDGTSRARGGSYRSEQAAELKSWAEEIRAEPAPHVGFRCAYSPGSAPGASRAASDLVLGGR